MRTIFFHAIDFTSDIHHHFMPSANIGEKCSVGGFSLVRTAHPRTVHPADFWSLKAPPRGRAQGRKIKNLSPLQGKPGLFAMPTLDRANGQ